MAFGQENRWSVRGGTAAIPREAIDAGLREYMLRVYNYMASGLALTGIVAYLGYSTGFYAQLAQTPLIWVVVFAPLGLAFFFGMRIHAMSATTAQATFWVFSAVMGLSLSYVFLRYTGTSIARVFFITAGTFAAMSLYGYTTKTDLSKFGSFLMMGLIGIIIASIVNIFVGSSALHFAISVSASSCSSASPPTTRRRSRRSMSRATSRTSPPRSRSSARCGSISTSSTSS
jgi:FtsH-binding integral membrane protein